MVPFFPLVKALMQDPQWRRDCPLLLHPWALLSLHVQNPPVKGRYQTTEHELEVEYDYHQSKIKLEIRLDTLKDFPGSSDPKHPPGSSGFRQSWEGIHTLSCVNVWLRHQMAPAMAHVATRGQKCALTEDHNCLDVLTSEIFFIQGNEDAELEWKSRNNQWHLIHFKKSFYRHF